MHSDITPRLQTPFVCTICTRTNCPFLFFSLLGRYTIRKFFNISLILQGLFVRHVDKLSLHTDKQSVQQKSAGTKRTSHFYPIYTSYIQLGQIVRLNKRFMHAIRGCVRVCVYMRVYILSLYIIYIIGNIPVLRTSIINLCRLKLPQKN